MKSHHLIQLILQAVASLTTQYRMAEDIQLLANTLVYNHRLRCGSEAIARQALQIVLPETTQHSEWMLKVGLL